MTIETPSLTPAQEVDALLRAGKLTSANITDPKISNQILENWKNISDASVTTVKTTLIKYMQENR